MSVESVRALLDRYGLRLQRERGQNFLVDAAQAARLADLAGVESGDTVIELGTGLGVLSRALAERAAQVVTVELDAGLVRALRCEDLLPPNVELLHADALALDLEELVARQSPPVRVVANLPYSAATPLLRRLLDLRGLLRDWSVTVQRELAQRVLASCGERDYGSLAVLHGLCVTARRLAKLAPRCFFPAPRVHSWFLRMVPRSDSPLGSGELAWLEQVARAAFGQRRKMVANALRGSGLGSERETIEEALSSCGIDPRTRAERLEPERLLALARALAKRRDSEPPTPESAAS